MKKIFVSTIIIIAFVLYGVLHGRPTTSLPMTTISTPNTTPRSSAATQMNVPTAAAGYKNGSYTGSAANAYWGNIQVQATITGGKLTDVTFLQYPNDRGRSVEINQYADPMLAQEAIQAQTAHVDTVSGATDTSEAFIQSLSSALAQAKS